MKLNTTVSGPAEPSDKTPVLLVHGLFGQARNLGVLARALSRDRTVVAVDMRNHGESFHDPDHTYPAMAARWTWSAIRWAARPRCGWR